MAQTETKNTALPCRQEFNNQFSSYRSWTDIFLVLSPWPERASRKWRHSYKNFLRKNAVKVDFEKLIAKIQRIQGEIWTLKKRVEKTYSIIALIVEKKGCEFDS